MRCGSPTIGRPLLALATLVVAGAAGQLGVLRAAPASAAASCVAVIVDARQLGGSVQTGCAQGDPSTGLQALTRAGFGYTPRPRDGLVCQINGAPACTDTTSATYWSYWYRAPGSRTWVYANQGAGTHNPKPGSTEAWVWQDGGRTKPPSTAASTICPQLAAKPTPTPAPSKASPKPARSTGTPTTAGTTRAAGPAGRGSATASAAPSRTAGAPGRTAGSAPPGTTSSARTSTQPPSPTSPPSSAGSSTSTASRGTTPVAADGTGGSGGAGGTLPAGVGLALGGVLVAGIGTAAVLRARRGHAS